MNDTSTNPQPPSPPSLSSAPAPPPIAFSPAGTLPTLPLPKNPGAAGVLGIIPGMGHLYLGLYQRAAILFGVWVLFISLAGRTHGPFPGIAIPFWMVFSIIDAVRQAKAINMTGRPEANVLGSDEPVRVSGSLTAGLLLILIGGFLLLDRFVTIDLSFLNDWWPLLLVAFGAWQVFRHYQGKRPASSGDSVSQ
ncbi:MAG: LiaI-LiaF-like domain-containing protein [Acidobacteriota bacterium]